jgi:hypothetical protein
VSGLRPVGETRGTQFRNPAVWAIAALPLFLLTKNVATAGVVTIDRFEYWICGLVPILVYFGLEWLKNSGRTGLIDVFSIGLAAWLFTLAGYLVLQLTFLSETFEFPMQEKFGYSSPISTAMTSVIYVVFGSICGSLLNIKSYKTKIAAHFATAFFVSSLNWMLFFVLVFAI